MASNTYRKLINGKQQLSLRLFLLLNTLSAFFVLISPLYTIPVVSVPAASIGLISIGLLLFTLAKRKISIHINIISLIFGLLWALHINNKFHLLPNNNTTFLIVSLMTILFIGSIAFINNLQAFLLHALPSVAVVLWLDKGEHVIRLLYALILPLLGITIQHIIYKRNELFTQRLMYKLLEEKETLTDLSMLDPLTNLYNRRGFQNRLENVFSVGEGDHFVLLLDIDHFKAYNDNYGHAMGDNALTRISVAIRDAVRSRDIVSRHGGEEFLVLLTNSTPENARFAAERIRQRVLELEIPHLFNEKVATSVTVSIGIAPLLNNNIDSAIELADKALYKAKHLGRNHILSSEELHAA